MTEKKKAIVAVVVIAISAIFIIKALTKGVPKQMLVVGCMSCEKVYTINEVAQKLVNPLECQYCGKNTVYRMVECQYCGATDYLVPGEVTQCPDCESFDLKQLQELPK